MLSIDTRGLKGLGKDGAGPWPLGDGRLLRVAVGSYGVEEAGYEVGKLQLRLHAARMRMGRNWKAEFLRLARPLRPLLPPEAGRKLVALVEAVPPCDVLLHGDLHLSNVVVRDRELAPVDMEFAGFGDPVFDLAISRSRTFQIAPSLAGRTGVPEERVSGLARRCWDAQLRGYLGNPDPAELSDADRRIAVLAEVERLGRARASGHAAVDAPSPGPCEGIAALADSLPNIDRLDLGDRPGRMQ